MKRTQLFRGGFYLGGLMLTALGSVLSAKAGLGVSATMAIPFAVTNVTGVKLSVTCFVVSSLMIVAQFLILGRESRKKDLLQFPLNLLFGIFLEWFGNLFTLAPVALWQKVAVMVCSILSTGTGVFLMVNMHLVPNPPDGLTHVIRRESHQHRPWHRDGHDLHWPDGLAVEPVFPGKRDVCGWIGVILYEKTCYLALGYLSHRRGRSGHGRDSWHENRNGHLPHQRRSIFHQ